MCAYGNRNPSHWQEFWSKQASSWDPVQQGLASVTGKEHTCTFRWSCITLVFCTNCGSLLWILLFTKCNICEVILFWPLTIFIPGSQCCHFKPKKPLSRTQFGLTASPWSQLWCLMQSLALHVFYSQLLEFGTLTLSLIYIFWIHVCMKTATVEVAV